MWTPNDQRQAIVVTSANVRAKSRRRYWGVSLIELMVVLVILGIIAGFAYPSYQDQVRKSRRASAQTALMDASARQEQFFLDNKSYTTTIVAGGLNMQATTEGGYYTISVDAPTAACPINGCYSLTATRQGDQTADSCGDLTLSSDGNNGPAGCW